MNEADYIQGSRRAWLTMLSECLRHLEIPEDELKHARWIKEREEAFLALRTLCEEFGDNDWTEHLHLADVIEKHLGRHLQERP